MSTELAGECLRRFENLERELQEKEKRIRDIEKFQVVIITIVGVANFVWVFFVYPFLKKHIGG